MFLGNQSQITIGTSNLDESLEFYEKLNFKIIEQNSKPNNWAQLSDGTIMILLNEDKMKYIGLSFFNTEAGGLLKKLKKMNVEITQLIEDDGELFQFNFKSPDDFLISIINHDASGMYQPRGATLATFPENLFQDASKYPNPKIGIFGELCHPVQNLNKSIEFWKSIGFRPLGVHDIPYPWAIMYDEMNIIGIHETTEFDCSAITYFAPDMAKRIQNLKKEGFDSFSEFHGTGGNSDNLVLETPEGQKFFLFLA